MNFLSLLFFSLLIKQYNHIKIYLTACKYDACYTYFVLGGGSKSCFHDRYENLACIGLICIKFCVYETAIVQ